jgi:hypothetical protein
MRAPQPTASLPIPAAKWDRFARRTRGVFSILPADQAGESGYNSGDSSVMKTVRVVTSVDYYLEK